jgi:transposase
VKRIGLEAGPLSAWLHAGLKRAGFDTVLLEMIEIKPWYAASRPRPDCIS